MGHSGVDSVHVLSKDERGAGVRIAGLRKRFRTGGADVVAVDDISLDIAPGALAAVTGASGSGKSTVLHLVGAIEEPDAGTIDVDGTELTTLGSRGLTAYRRGVGFVFQRYHLLPALTAWTTWSRRCSPTGSASTGRPAPANCLPRSASVIANAPCRPSCPAASSSGWPSPGR